MDYEKKTKKQLIEELKELRQCVSELKGFEKEIEQTRVNHEKFTKAFLQNSIPAGIMTLRDGRFVDVSDAFLRLMGRKRDEVVGQTSVEIGFITEEQRVIFFNELNKKGRVENLETEVRTKGGELRYGLFNAVMMSINNEKYFLVIMTDITKRKQAEEEIRKGNMLLSAIIENIPNTIFLKDAKELRFVLLNRMGEDLTGYSSTDLLGKNDYDFVPKEQADFFTEKDREVLRGKCVVDIPEEPLQTRTKGVRTLHTRKVPILNANGDPEYLLGISEDITDHKRMEDALVKSEEKFRLITENMMDCVALVDTSGTYQYVTPSYSETLGYDPEDMVGITGFSILHPDDLERVLKLYMEGIEQGVRELGYETRLRHKEGHYVHMELRARSLKDQQGKIVGGVLCARDITQRLRMEEELVRAHKLESLGVLAGGIAHDFNNLMAIVQGNIDLALMELPSDHDACQLLLTAMRSVDQTKDLTSRLITFSRGGGPLMEIFDVAETIRDAVHRTVKGTEVIATFDFMENLWPAEADEHQMKQVFYNLTTNAVEAMPQGGNLSIQVENALIPAGEVIDLKEGSYLKITFADEGVGIPEERLPKIFDPYFTTKGMGTQKGLGLGLSVCYSVLKKHGGHITVKSQPGKGASFVLYLPARADLAREKEVRRTPSTGTVRVLIMDDEPHIREIERAYLERMGYAVTDVKDGQEAIDTYRKALPSEMPFDLVMLDLTVRQGMGGKLAMERLLKIDPKIRAIIISGYVDDPVIENFADYGFRGALKKPFKGEEMKSLVEKILPG